MTTTLYINEYGEILGLADEVFDRLTHMGPKEVHRAADVEFDEAAQQWVATTADATEIGRHTSRAELIKLERRHLNNQIERQHAA